MSQTYEGHLAKPLIVERSADVNRQWILEVILDSLFDIEFQVSDFSPEGQQAQVQGKFRDGTNFVDKRVLNQSRKNVNQLLQAVLEDDQATVEVSNRGEGIKRLTIRKGDGTYIPTIAHLSAGQSLLFNLFLTIIRYADKRNILNTTTLKQIEGIVIVDEIEAHLHADLQYGVLPKLIQLFPCVQFILTSHSPLFLLGMENLFGQGNVQIIEMPIGKRIGTERFEEFRRSFEYYQSTQAFEAVVDQQLRASLKPLILTEGPTDAMYIRTALDVFGHQDLLDGLEISQVGLEGVGGSKGTGDTNLNKVREVLRYNQNRFLRSVMLLFDVDTNKTREDHGSVSVRTTPRNVLNTLVTKGTENLLPEELFREDRFYDEQRSSTGMGRDKVIPVLKKTLLCEWVCSESRTREVFQRFDDLLTPLIREFYERTKTNPPPPMHV